MRCLLSLLLLGGCGQALVDFGNSGSGGGGGGQSVPDLSIPGGEDLAMAEADLAGIDFSGEDFASPPDGGGNDDLSSADLAPVSCPAVHFSADSTQVVTVGDNTVQDPAGAFTVEAWVYPTAIGNHDN